MKIAMVCSPIIESHKNKLIPAYMDGYRNNPHIAPYLLAAIAKQDGFNIKVIDLTCIDEFNKNIIDKFKKFDIVIMSCNSTNWPTCRLLALWLKKNNPQQILILGGIHATLFGKNVIQSSLFDYVVKGEGEKVISPLLFAIENKTTLNKIPGLVWTTNNTIHINPPATLLTVKELDELPTPLYDEMPENQFKTLSIESSRGCLGSCSFCAIPFRKFWRPISPKAFVNKIISLQPYINKVDFSHFSVVDDCLTIDKERALSIVSEISKHNINFSANYDARIIDFLDENLVEKLAPYTSGVLLGAESFSSNTLAKIKKPITPKQIVKCAHIIEKSGLAENTVFSFIIGFPWESKSDIQKNLCEIVELAFKYGIKIFLQWHTLTPGSNLWNEAINKGKISIKDLDKIGFLLSKKWFYTSSNLTIEERLDLSDMVISAQKVLAFTKPYKSMRSQISFTIPPYLLKNKYLTEPWRNKYEINMNAINI